MPPRRCASSGVCARTLRRTRLLLRSTLSSAASLKFNVEDLSGSFRFFPAFLLLGLLTYMAQRWREFLVNCHTVQARIHDIGVSVGSAVTRPSSRETRTLLFQLYRYLNAIHGLTYQSIHPFMPKTLDGFVDLGLLSTSEVLMLQPVGNKSRDTIITWAAHTVETMITNGQIRELAISPMLFPSLRGICARHHDLFVRNMPNAWFAIARLFIDLLVYCELATLVSADMPLDHRSGEGLRWRDMWLDMGYDRIVVLLFYSVLVYMSAFIVAAAYWLAWSMVHTLAFPFSNGNAGLVDDYNTDALLGSTDKMLFASLRALFDYEMRDALAAHLEASDCSEMHDRSLRSAARAEGGEPSIDSHPCFPAHSQSLHLRLSNRASRWPSSVRTGSSASMGDEALTGRGVFRAASGIGAPGTDDSYGGHRPGRRRLTGRLSNATPFEVRGAKSAREAASTSSTSRPSSHYGSTSMIRADTSDSFVAIRFDRTVDSVGCASCSDAPFATDGSEVEVDVSAQVSPPIPGSSVSLAAPQSAPVARAMPCSRPRSWRPACSVPHTVDEEWSRSLRERSEPKDGVQEDGPRG